MPHKESAALSAKRNGANSKIDATPTTLFDCENQDRRRIELKLEQLHAIGPRPIAELLVEFAGGELAVLEMEIDRFLRIEPEIYVALGGDQFPSPPIHSVAKAA